MRPLAALGLDGVQGKEGGNFGFSLIHLQTFRDFMVKRQDRMNDRNIEFLAPEESCELSPTGLTRLLRTPL